MNFVRRNVSMKTSHCKLREKRRKVSRLCKNSLLGHIKISWLQRKTNSKMISNKKLRMKSNLSISWREKLRLSKKWKNNVLLSYKMYKKKKNKHIKKWRKFFWYQVRARKTDKVRVESLQCSLRKAESIATTCLKLVVR